MLGAIWFVFGLYIAGNARSGVIVDRDGITVRGWVRSHRRDWPEVDAFELGSELLRPALEVGFRDGSRRRAQGFGARGRRERRLARDRVAELIRRAAAARAAG